jgi:hypothetical protein
MCFEFDALQPHVSAEMRDPRLVADAAAERLTLTSADGSSLAAALAECPEPIGKTIRQRVATRPQPLTS